MSATPEDKADIQAGLAGLKNDVDAHALAIGAQVRTIALGVLALCWLLLSGTQAALQVRFAPFTNWLLAIAALAVLTLVADWAQNIVGFKSSESAYRDSENETDPNAVGYPLDSAYVTAQNRIFYAKQILLAIACGWLLLTICIALPRETHKSAEESATTIIYIVK